MKIWRYLKKPKNLKIKFIYGDLEILKKPINLNNGIDKTNLNT